MIDHWLSIIILGLVEGLTEFLPVSSTGHLLLMNAFLGYEEPSSKVFDIVIQFGAILAVVCVYFDRLWKVAVNAPKQADAQRFIGAVLLAFLPAMVIGAFAHDFIKNVLFNPLIVSISLIIGGFVILWVEKKALTATITTIESMPMKTAFAIGLIQCLAMIPGVSRSGATIIGALLLKVERKTAAEFSFFLAIPTMAGATAYDLYKNMGALNGGDLSSIAIGLIVAFLSALVVVRSFVDFVGKHGFAPFAWYRIVVGSLALTYCLLP